MDDRVLRQGVRRLRAWLPAVRAEVERGNVSELHEPSTVFEGQAPHIVERAYCFPAQVAVYSSGRAVLITPIRP